MRRLHWGSNYIFENNSAKHAVVLLTLAMLAVAVVAVGRCLAPVVRRQAERLAALLLVGVWLVGGAFDLANPRASTSTTLPLHWCDLCGALAAFVMFAPRFRAARAILHFWALCICVFAFLTPNMGLGPALRDFWIYFGTHAAIVLTAVYDRGVRGFVPGRRDVGIAWSAALVWTILLQPVNLLLDANYGYVGASAEVRGAIKSLGPWPWRLAPMLGIELTLMTCVMMAEHALASALRFVATRRDFDTMSIPFPTPSVSTTPRELSVAA